MDLQEKLQNEVDDYNSIFAEEQETEQKVIALREKRATALGRVRAIEELLQEQLKEESLEKGEDKDAT